MSSRPLAELLRAVEEFVRRFVVIAADQACAVALWVAHAHGIDAAEATPYLAITSATKRAGKTRLLEVLELLLPGPIRTADASEAVLFRTLAEGATLLLDEADATLGNASRGRRLPSDPGKDVVHVALPAEGPSRAFLFTIAVLVVAYATLGYSFDRWNSLFLQKLSALRIGWLDPVMVRVDDLLSSRWTVGILRLATMFALIGFRRWRHLLVFLASIVIVEALAYELAIFVASPRPDGVRIIASWSGPSFPSPPVAGLAVTLVGIVYSLVPAGRSRSIAKWLAGGSLFVFAFARLYEAVDHPTDILSGLVLGVGLPVVAFRVVTPNEVFTGTYRRSRAAHLDVGGRRGEAIRAAVRDQWSHRPRREAGRAGGIGRLHAASPSGRRGCRRTGGYIFAKLYARSHVRADRSYKFGRAILYGALEDEAPFQSVRRFVEYEDYTLLLLHHLGLPTPTPYGFVEITPEREYMIVMEFFDGAVEVGDATVDDEVIDGGVLLVRRLWDAGLAHRDIKPANLMVRDGKLLLIDVFFVQVRPSPWRQAVDLANMMLVLSLRTDAQRVYRHALRYFSEQEIAEAFAATRGVASPTQLRAALKRDSRDLLSEFRALAPERSPVAIQRWSVRRLVLGLSVLAVGGLIVALVIGNWRVVA